MCILQKGMGGEAGWNAHNVPVLLLDAARKKLGVQNCFGTKPDDLKYVQKYTNILSSTL